MELDQLGQIGEFVGGLAVLVTLVLLLLQLRLSNATSRVQVMQYAMGSATGNLQFLAQNPALNAIWFDGMRDLESLSREEFQVFNGIMASLCRSFEIAAYHIRSGSIEREHWDGLHSAIVGVMRMPGSRRWWELSAGLYSPALRELVADAHARPDDPEWVGRVMGFAASLPSRPVE